MNEFSMNESVSTSWHVWVGIDEVAWMSRFGRQGRCCNLFELEGVCKAGGDSLE